QLLLHRGSGISHEITCQEPFGLVVDLKAGNGISLLPFGNFFLRTVMSLVTARMTNQSVRFQLQKGRPFSFPSSSRRFLHRLINGLNVIAIDGPAWNSIGCSTIADLLDFHDLVN